MKTNFTLKYDTRIYNTKLIRFWVVNVQAKCLWYKKNTTLIFAELFIFRFSSSKNVLNHQYLRRGLFDFRCSGAECYHVTFDAPQTFKVNFHGQCHNVKTWSDRQIIAPFWEIWVAESNDNVTILIGSSELAAYTHAQYKFLNLAKTAQKQRPQDLRFN